MVNGKTIPGKTYAGLPKRKTVIESCLPVIKEKITPIILNFHWQVVWDPLKYSVG